MNINKTTLYSYKGRFYRKRKGSLMVKNPETREWEENVQYIQVEDFKTFIDHNDERILRTHIIMGRDAKTYGRERTDFESKFKRVDIITAQYV